jgi:hypothetical protein
MSLSSKYTSMRAYFIFQVLFLRLNLSHCQIKSSENYHPKGTIKARLGSTKHRAKIFLEGAKNRIVAEKFCFQKSPIRFSNDCKIFLMHIHKVCINIPIANSIATTPQSCMYVNFRQEVRLYVEWL